MTPPVSMSLLLLFGLALYANPLHPAVDAQWSLHDSSDLTQAIFQFPPLKVLLFWHDAVLSSRQNPRPTRVALPTSLGRVTASPASLPHAQQLCSG